VRDRPLEMKSRDATKRARDVDSVEQTYRFQALSWSLIGVVLGTLAGLLTARLANWGPFLPGTVGALVGGGLVYLFATVVPGLLGRAVGSIVWPSGRSTPRGSDHSLGDALKLRGDFDAAIAAYREEAEARPHDSAPRLRAARLLRDELDRYEEAAFWFRQGLAASYSLDGKHAVLRELVEMAETQWREPYRVLPDLARFAEEHGGTYPGRWARDELASIKASFLVDL